MMFETEYLLVVPGHCTKQSKFVSETTKTNVAFNIAPFINTVQEDTNNLYRMQVQHNQKTKLAGPSSHIFVHGNFFRIFERPSHYYSDKMCS